MLDTLLGCQYLKGDFSNLYPAIESVEPSKLLSRFEEFYRMDEWNKARTLIEHGWRGLRDIVDYKYPFFGKNGHWDYVFSTKESNFKEAMTSYLQGNDPVQPSWKTIEYYVHKYKPFFDAHRNDEGKSHLYYAWNDFYATSLLDTFSCCFPKFRLCPYAATAFECLDSEIVGKLDVINSLEKSDHGCIRLNEKKYWIECVPEGWRFDFSEDDIWHQEWKRRFTVGTDGLWNDSMGKFSFKLDNNGYNTVKDLEKHDRIETGIAFIKALYELVKGS